MDSRREQIKILITSLMEHLKTWAKEAPTRIGIPEELQKDVDDLLPQFDNKRYESTSLPEFIQEIVTTELVAALDSLDIWDRLDGKAFVTVARILLATGSCLGKEQGLFQLMCVLEEEVFLVNTSKGNKKRHQRLAEFKATVGELLLFPLYFAFIDNSRPSSARRWIGFLLCHLIKDSNENIKIMKGFPSQWFKNLGKIIIECNDRLLKGVAGKLIAGTLSGLQLNDWSKQMKYFWPLGATSYYEDFPGDFEEDGWEQELFKFIDDGEKKHTMWQSTGFNATNITIGDCAVESDSTVVSITDFISAYVPRRGAQQPVWVDMKACNVELVDIYSLYTQEGDAVEEERLVDLQVTLVDYSGDGYLFLRSTHPSKVPDRIALTVKDIYGDHYADTIEKARNLARFVARRPAPGKPLSDLELPTGAHRSRNDTQAALEKRRETITSMAYSPTVVRIKCPVEGNLPHPPTHQKKHRYRSDSELSELSDPPEELEPVISLPIVRLAQSGKVLVDSGVDIPTSLEKPSVRNPLKQVKLPIKVHPNPNNGKNLDIYELPSDHEEHHILPVKGKGGKVPVSVKGKGKTTTRRPAPKSVARSAPEAEKKDTEKSDVQHRNMVSSKISEVHTATKGAKEGPPVPTATKPTPKIPGISKVSKNVQGKNPQSVSNEAMKHDINKEIQAGPLVHKTQGGRVVSAQCNVPKDPGMDYEAENAKPTEASRGAKVSKGKLISVLPGNIQDDTGGETKEAEVENAADNALPFKPSAIDGHTSKLASSGSRSEQAQTALNRKAKVSKVGLTCKRLKVLQLMSAEPVQLPGRTRRAAANVALAKLKLQGTSSSQYQDEEEQEGVLERYKSVESLREENRPSPSPQRRLLDVNYDDFPSRMEADIREGWLRALSSGPKEVEAVASAKAVGVSAVKDGSDNHFQQNSHAENKPVITGGALSDDTEKPLNEIGVRKRKRIVGPQPAHPVASVGLSQKQVSDKGNKASRTKLQAALDPKTPDVGLDNLLNRKPQIISWGKKGPLNQGRLVDTSGARRHRGLNTALIKARLARHEEEDSPSQRIGTKRQRIGTTMQGEMWLGNTECRSPLVGSLLISKGKTVLQEANSKKVPPSISRVNTHDMLDQGVQSHVPVSFSDLPETEIERQRDESEEVDHESLLAQILNNGHLDSVIQVPDTKVESVPQPSPHDFIPSECDSITENRVPLPKTPERKRTDFWNEVGNTRNIDIGSEGTTVIEGLFNQPASIPLKPQKQRMKQMVLSEDVPPVLIKQSGKRIESTTVDDPFRVDLSATRPPPSGFLERLNNICNRSTSRELKTSPEDLPKLLPKLQPQPLQFRKGKLLNATLKHTLGAKSRVPVNTISSLDSKVVKAVARKESLKREMPLTKATGKSMYAGLSLPTNNGLDTEMTLVNSSSLLCYSSGTEITSSSASVGSNVDDEESSNILGGSVEEASPEGASDDSSIQDLLNIFSEIGKLFEEDMRAQEAIAMSLLANLKSSALRKIGLLKRARKAEFDDYTKKLDGPLTKKGKHACWAAQTGLGAMAKLLSDREVKVKGNKVGCKENGYCRAEKIRAQCRGRWGRVDRSLKALRL